MNTLPWLIRRELWEHRSFFVVPVALAGLLLVLYLWGMLSPNVTIGFDHGAMSLADAIAANPEAMRFVFGIMPLLVPAVLLNVAMLLTWFFYLSYTLYSDRKDRSVLFWKSLPVSDTATVGSKLAVAMLVLPLITFVAILATTVLVTIINIVLVSVAGYSASEYVIGQLPLFSGALALSYGLVVQSLWYAPIFGWLLLVSAWAPRVPALWAVLPWLAVALIERSLFRTEHVAGFLAQRLEPVVPAAIHDAQIEQMVAAGQWGEALDLIIHPAEFLSQPGLYIGLALAAVLVAAAIWSRRYREAG